LFDKKRRLASIASFYGVIGVLLQLVIIPLLVQGEYLFSTIVYLVGLYMLYQAFNTYLPDFYMLHKIIIPSIIISLIILYLSSDIYTVFFTMPRHQIFIRNLFTVALFFLTLAIYAYTVSYIRVINKLKANKLISSRKAVIYKYLTLIFPFSLILAIIIIYYVISHPLMHENILIGEFIPIAFYGFIKLYELSIWVKIREALENISLKKLLTTFYTGLAIALIITGSYGLLSEKVSPKYPYEEYFEYHKEVYSMIKIYSGSETTLLIVYLNGTSSYTSSGIYVDHYKYLKVPGIPFSLGKPFVKNFVAYYNIRHIHSWDGYIDYQIDGIEQSYPLNYYREILYTKYGAKYVELTNTTSIKSKVCLVEINIGLYGNPNYTLPIVFNLVFYKNSKIVYNETISLSNTSKGYSVMYPRCIDSIRLTRVSTISSSLAVSIKGVLETNYTNTNDNLRYYIYPAIYRYNIKPYFNPITYFLSSSLFGYYLLMPYPEIFVLTGVILLILQYLASTMIHRVYKQ